MPAHVDGSVVEQRIVEAAAVLPTYGGVTGWAALRWLGGVWFTGFADDGRVQRPVRLALGSTSIRNQTGLLVSTERLDPRDLTCRHGLVLTSAVRAVCFEMRYAQSERAAVRCFEMAAYSDLVSCEELQEYADRHSGWTGIPQVRTVLPHLDENSWSPMEPDARSVWISLAGCPRPLCNAPVFDVSGRHIGTPDFIDPVAGVVGEYDGALHLEGARRHRDVTREAAFRAVGLETVTMTAPDWRDLSGFVARLHAAYARATRTPVSNRAWTLEQPPWWIDTSTVAKRRALTDEQRRRALRWRRV